MYIVLRVRGSSRFSDSLYICSIARRIDAVSSATPLPNAPKSLTFTKSSNFCWKLRTVGLRILEPVSTVYSVTFPLKVYEPIKAARSVYCVNTSVMPATGAPSSMVPLPMYNLRVSTLHPSSAPASCGKS